MTSLFLPFTWTKVHFPKRVFFSSPLNGKDETIDLQSIGKRHWVYPIYMEI